MERSIKALWFSADHDYTRPPLRRMKWTAVRDHLVDLRGRTAIGWFWIQRRGPVKPRPAKLIAEIGSGIEIYRKPSFLTRHDIAPAELLDWTAPVERNLSQLGLSRKDMGENPLWDAWVRLAPVDNPSMTEQRRAEQYIKDKTAAERFEQERVARAERWAAMTQAERDREDMHLLPGWEREKMLAEHDRQYREELIVSRAAYRAKLKADEEQREIDRAEALRIQRERIEAGRRATEKARAARERSKK